MSTAQEIAESHAFEFWKLHREYLTSKRTLPRPALDRAFLSAITAATDTLMERSVLAMSIMEEVELPWREAYEKSDKCPMLRAAFELRTKYEAAVAQAKEEDTKIRETIAATGWCESEGSTLGQVTSICDGLATLREKVKALELKEPASDNVNAVLQKALAWMKESKHRHDYCLQPTCLCGLDALRNELESECKISKALSEHSNAAGAPTGKQETGGKLRTLDDEFEKSEDLCPECGHSCGYRHRSGIYIPQCLNKRTNP